MSENNAPYKKWFQILFYTLQQNQTIIEFQPGHDPPSGFWDIINQDNVVIRVVSSSSVVVGYWFKNDETEIINQSIQYMHTNFECDVRIKSVDLEEREKFEDDTHCLNVQKRKEWEMQKKLLDNIKEILPGFPYVCKYGWEPESEDGKGDLILTDGKGIFAVVETKRLHTENLIPDRASCRRSKQRKKYRKHHVIEQAGRYKRAFINQYEHVYVDQHDRPFDIVAVVAVGITDEEHQKRHWPELFDERVFRAINRMYNETDFSDPEDRGSFYSAASNNSSTSSINSFLGNDGSL
ncbi:16776_t:CDS:1 [Acaulospora colombiana]|uniref:16776_t:CDS:1 n=1 Tax=Acaulospora colombiana TaxID=27376 RepID=A0ACA9K0G6_9GLOM|nr:16776_t:CDS:1 [Acaulospora colombiana]